MHRPTDADLLAALDAATGYGTRDLPEFAYADPDPRATDRTRRAARIARRTRDRHATVRRDG